MLSSIIGLLLNTIPEPSEEGGAVRHERVIFKFIENNFEKLQRLIELHIDYSKNLHDFELNKFQTSEDIEYLVEDYKFDVLELVDIILAFLFTS